MDTPEHSFVLDHHPGMHVDAFGLLIPFDSLIECLTMFAIFLIGSLASRQRWPMAVLAALAVAFLATALFQALVTAAIGDPELYSAFDKDGAFKIGEAVGVRLFMIASIPFGFGAALTWMVRRVSSKREGIAT